MSKGNELKPRIGFFGRRNVGKSTMINWLTGQQIAIVSDTAGTTTDPVRKSMEIGGIGPVVLVDTAGIDDEGELGRQRVEKSMAALAEVDLALLLYTEDNYGEPEETVERWCREHGTPMLKILTKAAPLDKEALIAKIKETLPESAYRGRSLLGDVVHQGDTVVLVLATGLLIPFVGTTLGSAMVFLMKNQMNKKVEKLLLRFCIRCNDCSICLVITYSIN